MNLFGDVLGYLFWGTAFAVYYGWPILVFLLGVALGVIGGQSI